MVEHGSSIENRHAVEATKKNWASVLEYLETHVASVDSECYARAIAGNCDKAIDYFVSRKLNPFNPLQENEPEISPFLIAATFRNSECLSKFTPFERYLAPEALVKIYQNSFSVAIAPDNRSTVQNHSELSNRLEIVRWFLQRSAESFNDFPHETKLELMLSYLNSAIKLNYLPMVQLVLEKTIHPLNAHVFKNILDQAKLFKDNKIYNHIIDQLFSEAFNNSLKDYSPEDKKSFLMLVIDIALMHDNVNLLKKILSNFHYIDINYYIRIIQKTSSNNKNIIQYIIKSSWITPPFANNFLHADESLKKSLLDGYQKILLNNFDKNLFDQILNNNLYPLQENDINSLVQYSLINSKDQLFYALKNNSHYSVHYINSVWLHNTLIDLMKSAHYSHIRQVTSKTQAEIISSTLNNQQFKELMKKLSIVNQDQYAKFLQLFAVDVPKEFSQRNDEYVRLLYRNALYKMGIKFNKEQRKKFFFNACNFGFNESIRELLNDGFEVNTSNINNSTGLHFAATYLIKSTIELLISEGANIAQRNTKGYTAFGCVEKHLLTSTDLKTLELLLPTKHEGYTPHEKDWSILHEISAENIISQQDRHNTAVQFLELFDFFEKHFPKSHENAQVIENRKSISTYIEKFERYGRLAADAYIEEYKKKKLKAL